MLRIAELSGIYRLVVSAELLAFIERSFVEPAPPGERETVRAEALREAAAAEIEIQSDGTFVSASRRRPSSVGRLGPLPLFANPVGCDTGRVTPRKQGLIMMVLGATALTLSAPWWLLGSLSMAGIGPRLGFQMGLVLMFVGFLWMFRRDRKGGRSRRRPRGGRGVKLRLVPRRD